jgi:hypothetical protein
MSQSCSRRHVPVREFYSEIPASNKGHGLSGLCFKAASKEFKKNYHYSDTSLYTQAASRGNRDHISFVAVLDSGNCADRTFSTSGGRCRGPDGVKGTACFVRVERLSREQHCSTVRSWKGQLTD